MLPDKRRYEKRNALPAPLPAPCIWYLELGFSSGSREVRAVDPTPAATELQAPCYARLTPFLLKSLGLLLFAANAFLSSMEFGTKVALKRLCSPRTQSAEAGQSGECGDAGEAGARPRVIQADVHTGQLDLPV